MATPALDYDALAKRAGSIGSTQPSDVDYDSLAKQAGSIGSTPRTPEDTRRILEEKYPYYFKDRPGAMARGLEGFKDYVGGMVSRSLGIQELGAVHDAANKGDYARAGLEFVNWLRGPGARLGEDALNAHAEEFKKVGQYAKAGRYSEAAGHALAGVTPFVGPMAADIAETAMGEAPAPPNEQVGAPRKPNLAGAVGKSLAAVTMAKVPESGPAATAALRAIRASGKDVAAGAAKLGTGAAVGMLPLPKEVKFGMGWELGKKGVEQIGQGVKKGFDAARGDVTPVATPPSIDAGLDPNSLEWTGAPANAVRRYPPLLNPIEPPSGVPISVGGTSRLPVQPAPEPPGGWTGGPKATIRSAPASPKRFVSPSGASIGDAATNRAADLPGPTQVPQNWTGNAPIVPRDTMPPPAALPPSGAPISTGMTNAGPTVSPPPMRLPTNEIMPPPGSPTAAATPTLGPSGPTVETAAAPTFTGKSIEAVPEHYGTHRNPTAAYRVDMDTVSSLIKDGVLDPTNEQINIARAATKHKPIRNDPARFEQVRKTMKIVNRDTLPPSQ